MQRLTPQLADIGGLEMLQWITVTTPEGTTHHELTMGEPPESYLPCKPDRFHRGRHRAPSGYTVSPLLGGTVAALGGIAAALSGAAGWL